MPGEHLADALAGRRRVDGEAADLGLALARDLAQRGARLDEGHRADDAPLVHGHPQLGVRVPVPRVAQELQVGRVGGDDPGADVRVDGEAADGIQLVGTGAADRGGHAPILAKGMRAPGDGSATAASTAAPSPTENAPLTRGVSVGGGGGI